MNKIERALIKRAKTILFEYAAEELERVKKEIMQKDRKTILNLFNTGIMLNLDTIKTHGIGRLLKSIENQTKKSSKK